MHETRSHLISNLELGTLRRRRYRSHAKPCLNYLFFTKMLKKSSTESVHIRIRVLYFPNFSQDSGNSVKTLSCKITNIVIFNMLISKSFQM